MTKPDIQQPVQTEDSSAPRSRSRVRYFLLGAVSAVALGGVALNTPLISSPVYAEAALNQSIAPSGPPSFAPLVNRVKGAVVSVRVKTMETPNVSFQQRQGMPQFAPGDPLERFFKQFGGPGFQFRQKPQKGMALGSGFIISSDGYVVTNNHVVDHATNVELVTDTGEKLPAKIIGTDKKTDLALLKITKPGAYPYVQFGDKTPAVGDWVVAVGNPFGLGGTVTAGIVSARGRDIGAGPYDDFLQIDAPVNRGNSGGPTFDEKGQVVGINTAIYSPSGGSVGIGFAIPADVAKHVIAELKDKGVVTRGYIGVQIQPVTGDIAESLGLKNDKGALVAEAKHGPAAEAGIKAGDVIVSVNGAAVDGPRELARRIASLSPDTKAQIGYIRDGAEKTVAVTLARLPSDRQAKADTSSAGPASLAGLGVDLAPAAEVPGAGKAGVVVAQIDPDGVAAQKGLRNGDIILDVGGKPVFTPEQVQTALNDARKDGRKAVLMRVKTGDSTHFVALATHAAS